LIENKTIPSWVTKIDRVENKALDLPRGGICYQNVIWKTISFLGGTASGSKWKLTSNEAVKNQAVIARAWLLLSCPWMVYRKSNLLNGQMHILERRACPSKTGWRLILAERGKAIFRGAKPTWTLYERKSRKYLTENFDWYLNY